MSHLIHHNDHAQRGHVPVEADLDSLGWWNEIRDGSFVLPNCGSCDHTWFPPTPRCPRCASSDVSLVEASTSGRLISWIVVHRALDDAFMEDTPYTIVAVEMEGGARLFGRLLAPVELVDGLAVEARSYSVGRSTLLGFVGV